MKTKNTKKIKALSQAAQSTQGILKKLINKGKKATSGCPEL